LVTVFLECDAASCSGRRVVSATSLRKTSNF
jgi:hypothetical protein